MTFSFRTALSAGFLILGSIQLLVAFSPARAEKLFLIENSLTGRVFRYEIGPSGPPTLDYTFIGSSNPIDVVFSATGEMFVSNSSTQGPGSGWISRFLDPLGTPIANGTFNSPDFHGPFWMGFRDGELFIANRSPGVMRFQLDAAGNAAASGSISTALVLDRPRGVTISHTDELLISECCGTNEIQRFRFDANGNALPNGSITGNLLSNPHGMVISPWGELFVASFGNHVISRFMIGPSGNVTANGVISGNGINGPLDVAFSPWGELFVSNNLGGGGVRRFLFNATHSAIANGGFTAPAPLAGLTFFSRTVDVSGEVASDCQGPLNGVTVNLSLPNDITLTTRSNVGGDFVFPNVTSYQNWSATLAADLPVAFTAQSPMEGQTTIALDQDRTQDFVLHCLDPDAAGAKMYLAECADCDIAHVPEAATRILRYDVGPPGSSTWSPSLDLTLDGFNLPVGFALSASGEMFVTSAFPAAALDGYISRILNPGSTPASNGVIDSPAIVHPQEAVFLGNELIVSNRNPPLLRIRFDGAGSVASIDPFATNLDLFRTRGVAVRNGNELLVVECCGTDDIERFVLDPSGNLVWSGRITGNMSNPHSAALSPWGELFVTNFDNNSVTRFAFDPAGNAVFNGTISGNGLAGPAYARFSPWGEFFVANQLESQVSRWAFDAAQSAVPNGVFETPTHMNNIFFVLPGTFLVSGTVSSCGGAVPGAIVTLSRDGLPVSAYTTLADGAYGFSVTQGAGYHMTIAPPEGLACTSPACAPVDFDLTGDLVVDLTLVDAAVPVFTHVPEAASYPCVNQVPAASPGQATATDNCGTPAVTMSESNNGGAGSANSPLVITRTWVATDGSGNQAVAQQSVIVIDDAPPVIVAPADVSLAAQTTPVPASQVDLGTPTASDNCGVASITNDAPTSFPSGVTTVTWSARDAPGNSSTSVQRVVITPLPVLNATIVVQSVLHSVGLGSRPGSTKTPLPLELRTFQQSNNGPGPDPRDYGTIWNSGVGLLPPDLWMTGPQVVDQGNGSADEYTIQVVPGSKYLVIGKATVECSGMPTTLYVGNLTGVLAANSTKRTHLQVMQRADGRCLPARTTEIPGSLLLVTEPEYLEFETEQELLPIIYESVEGEWSVSVEAAPPEGFVSDPAQPLTAELTDNTRQALQFTITDVGSAWTFTRLSHRIRHHGRDIQHRGKARMVNRRGRHAKSEVLPDETAFIPTAYALLQNFPDPFNPATTVRFDLPEAADVTLKVYNILGREVATLVERKRYEPGRHSVVFNAVHEPAGIYIYQLRAGQFVNTRKMVLLK